jgi:hypothetical protein
MASVQKHPPFWESYVSRLWVGKVIRDRIELEVLYIKNEELVNQTHPQYELYLLRAIDEERTLEFANRGDVLDKTKTMPRCS